MPLVPREADGVKIYLDEGQRRQVKDLLTRRAAEEFLEGFAEEIGSFSVVHDDLGRVTEVALAPKQEADQSILARIEGRKLRIPGVGKIPMTIKIPGSASASAQAKAPEAADLERERAEARPKERKLSRKETSVASQLGGMGLSDILYLEIDDGHAKVIVPEPLYGTYAARLKKNPTRIHGVQSVILERPSQADIAELYRDLARKLGKAPEEVSPRDIPDNIVLAGTCLDQLMDLIEERPRDAVHVMADMLDIARGTSAKLRKPFHHTTPPQTEYYSEYGFRILVDKKRLGHYLVVRQVFNKSEQAKLARNKN
jgi:hypothetical protein